jgi:uncharacterized peroxidase-related enzyme
LKIQEDYTQADLDHKTRVLLDFAAKVTLAPKELCRANVETLRAQGFSDVEILDAVQLIGYFNYSNRVMDSLGIEPEPEMRYRKKNT